MSARTSRHGSVLLAECFLGDLVCARIVGAMDRGRSRPSEIYADGFVVDTATRRSFDVDVDDATIRDIARWLAPAEPLVREAFTLPPMAFEGAGLLRYGPGAYYRRHQDVLPGADGEWPRRISLVLFLGSSGGGGDFEGGALRIHDEVDGARRAVDVNPVRGTLVAFPSHLPHEVLPVVSGTRDTIVDWLA